MKVAGHWRYVYRAIDQSGQVIDVLVSPKRDGIAARRFFERAIDRTKIMPGEIVTDLAPTIWWCWKNCCRRRGIVLLIFHLG